MSVQTAPGVPVLDSTDLQLIIKGTKIGFKIRHVPDPFGGYIDSIIVCEYIDNQWVFKDELVHKNDLYNSMGTTVPSIIQWIKLVLIPLINSWLQKRFSNEPTGDVGLDALRTLNTELLKLEVVIPENGSPFVRYPDPT